MLIVFVCVYVITLILSRCSRIIHGIVWLILYRLGFLNYSRALNIYENIKRMLDILSVRTL